MSAYYLINTHFRTVSSHCRHVVIVAIRGAVVKIYELRVELNNINSLFGGGKAAGA